MDDHVRRRVLEFSRALAVEEKERLEAAGTLVDLETLTVEIGDEVARQLAQLVLSHRSEAAAAQEVHRCPDCKQDCPVEGDWEPVVLQGLRGEIAYQEPRCYCRRCRRSFFPGGGSTSASGS